jgi:2-phospho-L-lactate transferase/gluconeogenesis factor (CofD/UPF0052 family)
VANNSVAEITGAAISAATGGRSKINVVLFSGGSGTHSITEALIRHRQLDLKILINAYDDGHSTGRLRKFIPGMLGPSDVRKNINRLMPVAERGQKSLKQFSDYRLPVGISRADALSFIDAVLSGRYERLPEKLAHSVPSISVGQLRRVCGYLNTFIEYLHQEESQGRHFDFTDCAVGNLLFAGCYLQQDRDFNRTTAAFSEFYEVRPDILYNITLGENLFLVAEKEDGTFLLNEGDIVAAQSAARIADLFLLDEKTYREKVENASGPPPEGWGELFRRAHYTPALNPECAAAIAEADVIVYGPGTQHSSLFPSYLTVGVGEAIRDNRRADKIFVGNIHRDFDMQEDDANDLARKFLQSMRCGKNSGVEWADVVTQFFLQRAGDDEAGQGKYIPFDPTRFAFPLETVRLKDWEVQGGRHYGGYVVDELRHIVQSRIDIELEPLHHTVSIVIPVLNEERTMLEVLKGVAALDFEPLGLSKEIIVVDGASTDRTAELARSIRSVKVIQLPSQLGRGAALRAGIEQARGNLIVFFPGDNEYRAEDIPLVVSSLRGSRFRAVFGSRSVLCTDLSQHLHTIYGTSRGLYLVSKYGGMLLSVLTLLLYNRYLSDVLSSVKGFDAELLRTLRLESNGRELDTEIIAKLSLKREYMLELPVEYKPRTRSAGKKITFWDGVQSIFALFRYRIAR